MHLVPPTISAMYQIFNRNVDKPLPLWLISAICFSKNFIIIPCLVILSNNNDNQEKKQVLKDQSKERLIVKSPSIDLKYFFWVIPLGKIGYSAYISHFAVIYLLLGKYIENGMENELNLFIYFLQVLIYSILYGTVLTLLVEKPIMNLYQLICDKMEVKNEKDN